MRVCFAVLVSFSSTYTIAEAKEQHDPVKFYFLPEKKTTETAVMLQTSYKDAAMRKHKFTSSYHALGMVTHRLKRNHVKSSR